MLSRLRRKFAATCRRSLVDLDAAERRIDAAMTACAEMNYAWADANLDEAAKHLPTGRSVASHLHIYETYYAIDEGKPLDQADVMVSRYQFARHLVGQAKSMAAVVGQRAQASSTFYSWYEDYRERASQQPKRIVQHGYRSWSASNDDGLIAEIFKRIGATNRYFIEFGMHDGVQANSTALLFQGWSGLRIEASQPYYVMGNANFRNFIEAGKLKTLHRFVTAENIDGVLAKHSAHVEPDLLSIDVDGNDYWIWKAVASILPRVVIVEYNSDIHPPVSIAQTYDPLKVYNGTNYYGASLEAIARLSRRKSYLLVGCSLVGDNAYFVRADLVGDHFHAPGDVGEHYEPNRVMNFPYTHMPGFGPYEIVEQD